MIERIKQKGRKKYFQNLHQLEKKINGQIYGVKLGWAVVQVNQKKLNKIWLLNGNGWKTRLIIP